MSSVIRHIYNKSNDEWTIRTEGFIKFRGHEGHMTFRRLRSMELILPPGGKAQTVFYTGNEVFGEVEYRRRTYDVKGIGSVFLDNGRVQRELTFGVGGPRGHTQAIFREVHENPDMLADFRSDGIAVNRTGRDNELWGNIVLGDITFVNTNEGYSSDRRSSDGYGSGGYSS